MNVRWRCSGSAVRTQPCGGSAYIGCTPQSMLLRGAEQMGCGIHNTTCPEVSKAETLHTDSSFLCKEQRLWISKGEGAAFVQKGQNGATC
eukprot:553941-Pelagomonas_calceolata.AAC.3